MTDKPIDLLTALEHTDWLLDPSKHSAFDEHQMECFLKIWDAAREHYRASQSATETAWQHLWGVEYQGKIHGRIFFETEEEAEEEAQAERMSGKDGAKAISVLVKPKPRVTAPQGTQTALERERKDHEKSLEERDHYHDMADKLAKKIAVMCNVDIGEHSNANCPWQNALDAIEAQGTDTPTGETK